MTDASIRSVYPTHDKAGGDVAPMPTPNAEPSPVPAPKGIDSLGFVMDVPVELTVELGRKNVRIADVLRLGPGSILELTKANGEPLDIYVNNRLVARGEAVVVGERYGIRLTEVLVLEESRRGGSSE
jgi:flagellar motor switch protein FliN/FliY